MILTIDHLALIYKDYTDLAGKIRREIKNGNLIKISRGIYENNKNTDGKYLASYIYGPSYLSFDYVLSLYNLIPESVRIYTSATYAKNRTKKYKNYFGTYLYRDIPKTVYSLGVNIYIENGYSYQLASPEKALCDKLYIMSPVTSIKDIKDMLFEDLRIYDESFWKLDTNFICQIADLYHSNNLKYLKKYILSVRGES